jgi:hypothetical protein
MQVEAELAAAKSKSLSSEAKDGAMVTASESGHTAKAPKSQGSDPPAENYRE